MAVSSDGIFVATGGHDSFLRVSIFLYFILLCFLFFAYLFLFIILFLFFFCSFFFLKKNKKRGRESATLISVPEGYFKG